MCWVLQLLLSCFNLKSIIQTEEYLYWALAKVEGPRQARCCNPPVQMANLVHVTADGENKVQKKVKAKSCCWDWMEISESKAGHAALQACGVAVQGKQGITSFLGQNVWIAGDLVYQFFMCPCFSDLSFSVGFVSLVFSSFLPAPWHEFSEEKGESALTKEFLSLILSFFCQEWAKVPASTSKMQNSCAECCMWQQSLQHEDANSESAVPR